MANGRLTRTPPRSIVLSALWAPVRGPFSLPAGHEGQLMDRSAVFIDAGYLLAESGKLCCGTGNRQLVRCDFARLIALIGERCRETADAPILRTYW